MLASLFGVRLFGARQLRSVVRETRRTKAAETLTRTRDVPRRFDARDPKVDQGSIVIFIIELHHDFLCHRRDRVPGNDEE
jgi:hypothetical protein